MKYEDQKGIASQPFYSLSQAGAGRLMPEGGRQQGKSETERRKATPIWSGVLRYFPDALAAVARLSKAGNDKHNPGQPLHWARGKSNDHGDCIVRHQMEPDKIDPETGELHAAAVAWRALAQLQLLEEARLSPDAQDGSQSTGR